MSEADASWFNDVARSSPTHDGPPFLVSERPTVYLAGELDLATGPLLAAALERRVELGGIIDVDLHDVTFIDSAGIVVLHRAAHALGVRGTIVVHHPTPKVQRVIDLTGLGNVVDVRPPTSPEPARTRLRPLRAV